MSENQQLYKATKDVRRILFPLEQHAQLDNGEFASAYWGGEEVTIALGTIVRLLATDGNDVALFEVTDENSEYNGRRFPSSPRTQMYFQELR